jgi:hypothetical protein
LVKKEDVLAVPVVVVVPVSSSFVFSFNSKDKYSTNPSVSTDICPADFFPLIRADTSAMWEHRVVYWRVVVVLVDQSAYR